MWKKRKQQASRKKLTSYYCLTEVRRMIAQRRVCIRRNALDSAFHDFGWNHSDVLDTISKLRPKHFYKTDPSRINPSVMIDYYKARGVKGENIYTHFYIDSAENKLIINSFKEIKE